MRLAQRCGRLEELERLGPEHGVRLLRRVQQHWVCPLCLFSDRLLINELDSSGAWKTGRASFATKATSAVSITTVLGSSSWIDSAYL